MRTLAVVFALAVFGATAALAQGSDAPAARTPHRTLSKEDCLSCHRAGANAHVDSVPSDHARYVNATCVRCHRPATEMPARSQHAFDAAHTRCATCHVAGNRVNARPTPTATHTRYHASTCAMCHEPMAAAGS